MGKRSPFISITVSTVVALFIIGTGIAIWNNRENKRKPALGQERDTIITIIASRGVEVHELYETGILENAMNPLREPGAYKKTLDALSEGKPLPGGCSSLSTCLAFCESQANTEECFDFSRSLNDDNRSQSAKFFSINSISVHLKDVIAVALWPIVGPLMLAR